jgi:hypothetical protein
MLAPHILEREDRKTLDLLRFALVKSGVGSGRWGIGFRFADLPPVDDCICLYGSEDRWIVSYTERGQWREQARFPESHDAIRYFYAQFHPGPGPHDMRKRWERATGQEFSMVE